MQGYWFIVSRMCLGKWCRPNYNSAVATFCHNIANDLPVQVNDGSVMMRLVYVDDVVDELIGALSGDEHRDGNYCFVPTVHEIELSKIVGFDTLVQEGSGELECSGYGRSFHEEVVFHVPIVPTEIRFRLPVKDERG